MPSAKDDILQLEALLVSRAYLYALFHKLLGGKPSEALVEALVCETTRDVVDEFAADSETMAGFVAFLEKLAAQDGAQLLDAAKDEYTRTFMGPAVLPASPYEGPYLTHDPSTFQENSLVVREIYRSFGYEPKRLQRVPDDHVALMLHYLSIRSAAALEKFRSGDVAATVEELRSERVFVADHMANWLGDYAVALRASKTAVLYPQAIEALAAFVAEDVVFADEASFFLEGVDASDLVGADHAVFAKADAAREAIAALCLEFSEENELARMS